MKQNALSRKGWGVSLPGEEKPEKGQMNKIRLKMFSGYSLKNAFRKRAKRLEQGQDKSGPEPHKTPAHLFQFCGGDRHPGVYRHKGGYRQQRGGAPDDRPDH